MSVQFPYRAIICGEEHIVKGWRGRKLITDKGGYFIRHIYADWQIQTARLFELASLQSDGNGGWLVNGKPLSFLESLPMSARFSDIPRDENLRVHKNKICAVGFVNTTGNSANVTELLDEIIKFWSKASLPPIESKKDQSFADILTKLGSDLHFISKYRELFQTWSKPIWLTEFRHAAQKIPASPQQKQLDKVSNELHETKATLRKTEAAAQDTLKKALSKWMKFDPPRMSADTKARIEKAVKLYLTDPEKRSLAKIAADFCVSRKTVSEWFAKFKAETGYSVVTHDRHVSVKEQLKSSKLAWDSSSDADSEQDEED